MYVLLKGELLVASDSRMIIEETGGHNNVEYVSERPVYVFLHVQHTKWTG
jgi:hypothetical protein